MNNNIVKGMPHPYLLSPSNGQHGKITLNKCYDRKMG